MPYKQRAADWSFDWSAACFFVSVLTWTAKLSTKSNGHAGPVAGCARGGLSGGMTKRWKEEGSNHGGNSVKT